MTKIENTNITLLYKIQLFENNKWEKNVVNLNLFQKCWHSSSHDLNNEGCIVWSAVTSSVSGVDIICLFIYF